MYVNNGANVAVNNLNKVASTSGEIELMVGIAPLEGRRLLMIQNMSNKEIYIGKTGISSANGLVLAARATIELDAGQDLHLFALGSALSQDIRVFEMA